MKFQGLLNNFISGEWSPKMMARSDTDQYPRACRLMRNAFTQPQGGAFKRPGFRQVVFNNTIPGTSPAMTCQEVIDNSTKRNLFDWTVNGVTYLIFANENSPTAGVAAYPWFVMNTATNQIYGITGSSQTDAGDPQIDKAQVHQVGDVLFIVSPGAQPRMLRIEGASMVMRAVWEYWSNNGAAGGYVWQGLPFSDIYSAGVNGVITATGTFTVGGSVTLQGSGNAAPFTTGMDDGDNFGIVAFFDAANLGFAVITAVTDSDTATAIVLAQLPGSSPKAYGAATGTAWAISAWNPDAGWPTSVTSFEQRLYFGRGNQFWGSRIGNVFDMYNLGIDTTDYSFTEDNSVSWNGTLTTTKTGIKAMGSSKTLVFNCGDSETVMFGQTALGKRDVSIEASTFFGAEPVVPIRVNNYLTFVQAGGRRLRDIIFNFDENQYKSNDLMFPAEHLTLGDPIRQMVAGELCGASMVFARTASGKLLSLMLDRDYQINAWARHPLGGEYIDGSVTGEPRVHALSMMKSQSITFTNETTGTEDVLYALVERTIGSETDFRLEVMERFYDPDDERILATDQPSHPFYLDSSCVFVRHSDGVAEALVKTTYAATPTAGTAWTGLTRYAGATVRAFADGIEIGDVTVDGSGNLTLDTAATWLYLGYKYKMQLQPVPLEFGAQIGSAQGIHKRANELYARFYKSVGCKYGIAGDRDTVESTYEIEFREPADPLNEPVPLKTWDRPLKMPGGYRRTLNVYFESDFPYPCNVLSLVYGGLTYDV